MICIINRGDGTSPLNKTKKKVRMKIIMKRILAVILAVTMIFGLVACGKKDNTDATTTATPDKESTTITPEFTEGTAGETLWNAFLTAVKENESATVEEIANTLITNPIIPFMGGAMAVEPGFLQGFNEEISGFEKGAVFMPMMGSIAFVGYVFELAEDADVNAFISTLKTQSNPRWNICVTADYTQVGAYENKVYFLMYPADLDNAQAEGGDASVIYPDVAENTWGETLWVAFEEAMIANPEMSVAEVANTVVMHESIQFMGGAMEVVPGWLQGFTEEMSGFKSGASFGPMMGSIAFVGYVFEMEEGADINAFMDNLKAKCDPRWNICVTADQTVVGAYNDYVFFLMCPFSNEGNTGSMAE